MDEIDFKVWLIWWKWDGSWLYWYFYFGRGGYGVFDFYWWRELLWLDFLKVEMCVLFIFVRLSFVDMYWSLYFLFVYIVVEMNLKWVIVYLLVGILIFFGVVWYVRKVWNIMFWYWFNFFNFIGMDLLEEDLVIYYVFNDGCCCVVFVFFVKFFENVFFKV